MSMPVHLHGVLAAHRRGQVLQEALAATPGGGLPLGRALVLLFADDFQASEPDEQSRLIEWTRSPGHLLLLVPPFATAPAHRPVAWRAERLAKAPRGGEGIAKVLSREVAYRLTGDLQTPSVPGATWSDLSVNVGTYRLHPAAGLFAATCLPIWSLSVLEVPHELETWLSGLLDLAGQTPAARAPESARLQPDHYGFLVFLLSQDFQDEDHALDSLRSSRIFRFSPERGRALLSDLHKRGLAVGAVPTKEAQELVMQSAYAPYARAAREVSR